MFFDIYSPSLTCHSQSLSNDEYGRILLFFNNQHIFPDAFILCAFLLMGFIVITIPMGLIVIVTYIRAAFQADQFMGESTKRKTFIDKRVVVKTVVFRKPSAKEEKVSTFTKIIKKDKATKLGVSINKDVEKKNRIFCIETHRKKTSRVLDSTSTCAICWNNYEDGDIACCSRNKRCSHVFHEACIMPWLLKRNDCPLCRSDFLHNSH